MLRTTRPTTHHHIPADWNIFCTIFLLAENIKIPCLGCDGGQFDRRRCLRGRNLLHLHGQPWLHTITPQQTVTHTISTVLPVLFNACFILIMYLYVCLQSSNTVAWFYLFLHTVLRYFHYQHMSLNIFFTPLNYASSLPNSSTVDAQFIFQCICQLLTYRTLMIPSRNYKMHRIPCEKVSVYSKNDHCECGHLPGRSSTVFR